MRPVPARHTAVAGVALAGLAAALYLAHPVEPSAADDAGANTAACLHVPLELAVEALPAAPKAPNPVARARKFSVSGQPTLDETQRFLVRHLSRRFQIARETVRTIVTEAYRAGESVGLDPLLLLAVISVESSFNPVAESVMGAKGLMQIIPRYHLAKLEAHGGESAVLDPVSNIHVGARILKEYIARMGSLEGGLQFYNGAAEDPSFKYAGRVLAEHQRLRRTLQQAHPEAPLRAVDPGASRSA